MKLRDKKTGSVMELNFAALNRRTRTLLNTKQHPDLEIVEEMPKDEVKLRIQRPAKPVKPAEPVEPVKPVEPDMSLEKRGVVKGEEQPPAAVKPEPVEAAKPVEEKKEVPAQDGPKAVDDKPKKRAPRKQG